MAEKKRPTLTAKQRTLGRKAAAAILEHHKKIVRSQST